MVCQLRFHRWSNAQRLMHFAKIVVHVVQRNRVTVVVDFLAVAVREPRESAHVHPHG
jgi:hypothetical protein